MKNYNLRVMIDEDIYNLLNDDLLTFDFSNMHSLISTIIVNYKDHVISNFKDSLRLINQDRVARANEELLFNVKKLYIKSMFIKSAYSSKRKNISIHIKNTTFNYRSLEELDNFSALLTNESGINITLSKIVFSLIQDYSKLSSSERELILFRNNYLSILDAISLGKKIRINLIDNSSLVVSPINIIKLRNDDYNYFFYSLRGFLQYNNLSYINEVLLLDERSTIRIFFNDDQIKEILEKGMIYKPISTFIKTSSALDTYQLNQNPNIRRLINIKKRKNKTLQNFSSK